MDQAVFNRICQRIDESRERVIEIQSELVRRPALQPAGGGLGEGAKAAYLTEFFKQHGISDIREVRAPDPDAPDGYRPNLIVRIPGEDHSRTTWFMAHLDVVPTGDPEAWDSDPFELRVDGDRLYGRGTEDNHQGLVSAAVASLALLEEGVVPPHDVALLLVADEETGSKFGIEYVVEHDNPLQPQDIVVVPDGGDPQGLMIEVAEKSIFWIRAAITGKTTHGSTPGNGRNATEAAAHLCVRLMELREVFGIEDPLFDPPASTFAPTKREPNVDNINNIPGADVSYFDCRILPRYDLADVERAMRERVDAVAEQFGVTIDITYPQREAAAPPTDPDAPVVLALTDAVKEVYDVDAKPGGIGGGTVAAVLRRAGIPAAVWSRLEETLHAPNEYCVMSNLLGDAKVFAHLMLRES